MVAPVERALATLLREPATAGENLRHASFEESRLLAAAERHGLVYELLETCSPAIRERLVSHGEKNGDAREWLAMRRVARELEHAAHWATLGRIDAAFARAGVHAVVLKGVPLAKRFYAVPASRPSTDIDVLVTPSSMAAAECALASMGYALADGANEVWARKHHHHVHFAHPQAIPIELHFHAYRGFGSTWLSPPLLERACGLEHEGLRALSVLAPDDELGFLAVHAAAHRFERLGWLYDCYRLALTMTGDQIRRAYSRAKAAGFGYPFALCMHVLDDAFGPLAEARAVARELGLARSYAAKRLLASRAGPGWLRSGARAAYGALLSPSKMAAMRHAARLVAGRVAREHQGGH